METVIAKTAKGWLAAYIVILVFGAIVLLFGILEAIIGPKDMLMVGLILIVLGGVLTGGGIGWTVYFARLPKIAITFKEGKFNFWNGLVCSPSEVTFCDGDNGWFEGGIYNIGKLTVAVNGSTFKIKFVKDVVNVAAKINALKAQTMAIEEVQKHIAEKNAVEATQNEENQG